MKAASIVLFNPDVPRLMDNIKTIIDQVDRVILVDNGDSNQTLIQLGKVLEDKRTAYIDNGGNKGIAHALNRAVEYCLSNGIDWLLTLDQDSICPSDIISVYESYTKVKDVSIICCAVNYNNQEISDEAAEGELDYALVEMCITSASYMNVKDCMLLGGFDESMFIDRVDFEYCHRIRKAGKIILQTNRIVLAHQLGNLELKHIGNNGIHVGGHGAFRKYYMARNLIYCSKKHPEHNSVQFCISKEIKLLAKTLVYEKQKYLKIKAILRGIKDGVFMKVSVDNWLKTDI